MASRASRSGRPPGKRSVAEARSESAPQGLPLWAALCFLLSGAAGLLYEVVWSKEFSYLLGNTLHSAATVVAAFLAGLALGAFQLGPRLARRRQGARTYAALELGIALWGLLSMPVLRGLDPLLGALYQLFGGQSQGFLVARFLVLFLLLLPPTALMGATLPVLVSHFEQVVGRALARLYAINTAGAVAGSLVGGFLLVPSFGLLRSTWWAGTLNLVAALIAMRAARESAGQGVATRLPQAMRSSPLHGEGGAQLAPSGEPQALLPGWGRAMLALLFALSGAAALAFQIAWMRLFGLVFGSSVYAFAGVLAVYLAGLAAGSALVGPYLSRPGLLLKFVWLQLALAISALACLHLFPWLPEAFFSLSLGSSGRWWLFYAGELALSASVLAVPCLILGAVFPVAARLLQTRDSGHATGWAYAVNTIGTLAGSLLAGFVLIPRWGVQGTHLAAACLSGAIGLGALAIAARLRQGGMRSALAGAMGATLGGWLAFSAPPWDPALMSAGLYRSNEAQRALALVEAEKDPKLRRQRVHVAARNERTLFYREGVNGSVYVGSNPEGTVRWLKLGGKVEASTGALDRTTQVLLGVLPQVCSPRGAQTAVVGLGSGMTLSAMLAAGAGPVDVLEFEPAVVEASRFFHEPGRHPLDDPRARLVITDARAHLTYTKKRYDVIVSEPSNPWMAGVNNLFTLDFYRKVKARLAPGGVFCQWIQLYELSPATLGSLIASYVQVFPQGYAFTMVAWDDLVLIAMPEDRTLPLDRVTEPAVRQAIASAGLLGPESLPTFYGCPLRELRALAVSAPFNTDDRPVVEYRAPRDLYRIGQEVLGRGTPAQPISVPYVWRLPARGPFSDWTLEQWFRGRVLQLSALGRDAMAAWGVREARAAGLTAFATQLEEKVESQQRARQVSRLHGSARAATLRGELEAARDTLLAASRLDPGEGRTWLLLAETLRKLGDAAGARAACARALAVGDSIARSGAEVVAGVMEIAERRPLRAAERFRAAQRWDPGAAQPYLFEARALEEAGSSQEALEACRRGLEVAPAHPELRALFEELTASHAATRPP